MRIEIDEIQEAIREEAKKNNLPQEVINNLSASISRKAKELEKEKEAEDGEKPPRKKSQYVLVTDQTNIDIARVNEMEFFIVKINEEYDHDEVPRNLFSAANYFNQNDKKGKKNPIQGLADAFRTLKKKHFNVTPEENTPKIVTKIPCIVVGAQMPKAKQ